MILELSSQQVFRLSTPPQSLRVLTGRLWLTQTGQSQDWIVSGGEVFSWHGRGWVAQALEPTRIAFADGESLAFCPDLSYA